MTVFAPPVVRASTTPGEGVGTAGWEGQATQV